MPDIEWEDDTPTPGIAWEDDPADTQPKTSVAEAVDSELGMSVPGVPQLGAAMNTAIDYVRHPGGNIADTYEAWRQHQIAKNAQTSKEHPWVSAGTGIVSGIGQGVMAAPVATGKAAQGLVQLLQAYGQSLNAGGGSMGDTGGSALAGHTAGKVIGGGMNIAAKGLDLAGRGANAMRNAADDLYSWIGRGKGANVEPTKSGGDRIQELLKRVNAADKPGYDPSNLSPEEALAYRLAQASRKGKAQLGDETPGQTSWDPAEFGDDFRDMSTRSIRETGPVKDTTLDGEDLRDLARSKQRGSANELVRLSKILGDATEEPPLTRAQINKIKDPELRAQQMFDLEESLKVKNNPAVRAKYEKLRDHEREVYEKETVANQKSGEAAVREFDAERGAAFNRAKDIKRQLNADDVAKEQASLDRELAKTKLRENAAGRKRLEKAGGAVGAVTGLAKGGPIGAAAGAAGGPLAARGAMEAIDWGGDVGKKVSAMAARVESLAALDGPVGRAARWAMQGVGRQQAVRLLMLSQLVGDEESPAPAQ